MHVNCSGSLILGSFVGDFACTGVTHWERLEKKGQRNPFGSYEGSTVELVEFLRIRLSEHVGELTSSVAPLLLHAMAALPSLRTALRTLLPPLPSFILRRVHAPLRAAPPSLLARPALPSLLASPLLRSQTSHHLLQVRCSGSLKAKGKPRGPLWRQRKGVSKEALQVVFELKQCKGDKQKERKVLQTSGSRLLKMDLLMVLVELRRQEECSLAKQVFNMVRKEEWYKPDVFLYREMIDTLGKNKLMEDVEQIFQEMQEEGISLNAMILTELMGAYIRNDNIVRAYEVYQQIRAGGEKPEYITYEILCRGLKKAGDFDKLKIVMEHCGEDYPDNPPPFSRMVMELGL